MTKKKKNTSIVEGANKKKTKNDVIVIDVFQSSSPSWTLRIYIVISDRSPYVQHVHKAVVGRHTSADLGRLIRRGRDDRVRRS